jgi:hypothetical protein
MDRDGYRFYIVRRDSLGFYSFGLSGDFDARFKPCTRYPTREAADAEADRLDRAEDGAAVVYYHDIGAFSSGHTVSSKKGE